MLPNRRPPSTRALTCVVGAVLSAPPAAHHRPDRPRARSLGVLQPPELRSLIKDSASVLADLYRSRPVVSRRAKHDDRAQIGMAGERRMAEQVTHPRGGSER